MEPQEEHESQVTERGQVVQLLRFLGVVVFFVTIASLIVGVIISSVN